MLGAIIEDIIGSVYEWHNIKTTEFPLFQKRCRPTDDSIMTIAVAEAYYGIPEEIKTKGLRHLDDCQRESVNSFRRFVSKLK